MMVSERHRKTWGDWVHGKGETKKIRQKSQKTKEHLKELICRAAMTHVF
jgi:hypothetical protein